MNKSNNYIIVIIMIIALFSCDKKNNNKNDRIDLKLPNNFKIEGSVFYNERNEKIGEFSPGLINKNEKTFDEIKNDFIENYKNNIDYNVKSISDTKINGKNILKIVTSNATEGGSEPIIWEPNKYIIDYNSKYIISITFYNYDNFNIDEMNIKEIISTIKIVQ